MLASDIYGGPPTPQPDPRAAAAMVPSSSPTGPANVASMPQGLHKGLLGNPTVALVLLLGAVVLLVKASLHGGVTASLEV